MPPQKKSNRGFALVIALSLMAFVLLLLLSITTMVQVETKTAQIGKDQLEARMNALLGLQMAFGEVQMKMGPDQRVSAAADLLESTDQSKSNWIGVWDADETSATYSENLGWLVSAPDGTTNNAQSPQANNTSLAKLVRTSTSGIDADDFVLLPQVQVEDRGNYAWWVDDEGLKARLNPSALTGDYTTPGSHLESQMDDLLSLSPTLFNTLSTSYPGIQALDRTSDLPTTYSAINKATANGQLTSLFTAPSSSTTLEFETDFDLNYTASAAGLLTDVKNGGLRKNLTAAFTDDSEFAKLLNDAGKGPNANLVFGQHDSSNNADDDPGGPRWEQLRAYFRLADQVSLANSTPSIPLISPDQQDRNSPVTPILTQMQLFVYAGYLSTGPNEREVVYFFLPGIVLWNPYNTAIEAPDLYVRLTNYEPDKNDRRGGFRYGFVVDDGTASNFPTHYYNNLPNELSRADTKNSFKFKIGSTVFKPGEARIFTAGETQELDLNDATNNELADGLSSGYAFYFRTGKTFTETPNSGNSYDLQLGGQQLYELHWQLATEPEIETEDVIQSVRHISAYGSWGASDNGGPKKTQWVEFPEPYTPRVFSTLDASTNIDQNELVYGYKSSLQLAENNTTNPNGSGPKQWLGQFNPRGSFSGKPPLQLSANQKEKNTSYVSGVPISGGATVSDWATIFESSLFDGKTASIGYSDTTAGNTHTVLFEVPHPDVPFQSIGQLGMVNFSRGNHYDNFPNDAKSPARFTYNNLQPAFPLGNSNVSATIPKNQTSINWSSLPDSSDSIGATYDYSYNLNEALWDKFFFTSENWVKLESDQSKEVKFPLTNPRMLPSSSTVTYADLRDYDTTATQLIIDGAFNINSTKVEAWKSILGSFFGQSLQFSNVKSGGSLELAQNADQSPFARLPVPTGDASTRTANSSNDSVYTGFRTLSVTEIDTLANQIVSELKKRRGANGPFLSLSDFINRTPDASEAEFQLRGLLQAAIGNAQLNAHLETPSDLISAGDLPPAYPSDQVQGSLVTAAPSFLMQSDLLTKLAPILSPRSDTFRIRSYGNSNDPITGEANSEAWCEAIIQRIPEPIDSSTPTYANADRRFIITAFRWLSKDEI
jgi:hypothetical protein